MTTEEIIEKLKPIVKPFVKGEEAFNNLDVKTDFITDLNINSANLVDIVLDVEDAFGIRFTLVRAQTYVGGKTLGRLGQPGGRPSMQSEFVVNDHRYFHRVFAGV